MSSKDDEYDYLFKGKSLRKKTIYFLFIVTMLKMTCQQSVVEVY